MFEDDICPGLSLEALFVRDGELRVPSLTKLVRVSVDDQQEQVQTISFGYGQAAQARDSGSQGCYTQVGLRFQAKLMCIESYNDMHDHLKIVWNGAKGIDHWYVPGTQSNTCCTCNRVVAIVHAATGYILPSLGKGHTPFKDLFDQPVVTCSQHPRACQCSHLMDIHVIFIEVWPRARLPPVLKLLMSWIAEKFQMSPMSLHRTRMSESSELKVTELWRRGDFQSKASDLN
eukprot:2788769-Amphidinium_carterae.1